MHSFEAHLRLAAAARLLAARLVGLALLERLGAALARARRAAVLAVAVLARLELTRLDEAALDNLGLGLTATEEAATNTAKASRAALRALGRRAALVGAALAVLRDLALRALRATTLAATRLDLTGLNVFGLHLFRFRTQRQNMHFWANFSDRFCDDPKIRGKVGSIKVRLRNRTLARLAPRGAPRIANFEFLRRIRKADNQQCVSAQEGFRTKWKANIPRFRNLGAHKRGVHTNANCNGIPSSNPLFDALIIGLNLESLNHSISLCLGLRI